MASLPMDSNHVQISDANQPYYSKMIKSMFNLNDADLPPKFQTMSESNISYHPNLMEDTQRNRPRRQLGIQETDLPAGWPRELAGPLAWKPDEFSDEGEFIYHLTPNDIAEITEALHFFNGLSLRPLGVPCSSY